MTNAIVVQQESKPPLYLLVIEPVEIGRECDGLIVADQRVSRRHLRIDHRDGQLMVTDLDSRNGTFLGGQQLQADQPTPLTTGSVVTFGGTTIKAHPLTVPDKSTPSVVKATVTAPVSGDESGPTVRPDRINDESLISSIETMVGDGNPVPEKILAGAIGTDATVTIMFSDIESSTQMAVSMGDTQWMAVLNDHNGIFERRVAQYGGTIVKNQGDGYMLAFGSARRALLCAAHVQHDLREYCGKHPARAIRVRMGCHTGEAIERSGDLFGRHVIIAARVADLAEGAQINVSSIVKEITAARGDLAYGPGRDVELKGVDGVHHIYDLDWDHAPIGSTA